MTTENPIAHIVCRELTKSFSKSQIGINDVNLDLEFKGLGLLGPNGSGKTTFIKLLLGIISPTQGSINVNVPHEHIRVVADQPVLPWKMTIDEWVYTLEHMYGSHLQGIDIQTDLSLEGHWKLNNLSAGQKRKVALLPAFYGKPQLILLDEPSNYLDIATREYILKLLKKHVDNTGANVIISTHNVDEIRLFADNVLLLKEGRLMNNVTLESQEAEWYSIKPSNVEKLEEEFYVSDLYYFLDNTIQGEIIKVEPSPKLWPLLDNYTAGGERIVSFKVIDILEKMIEDLTK